MLARVDKLHMSLVSGIMLRANIQSAVQSASCCLTVASLFPPRLRTNMKEYKVMTQKDRFFAGKFDPEKLESAINAYAEQGWEVVSMTTASIPSFGGSRDELVVLMERAKA